MLENIAKDIKTPDDFMKKKEMQDVIYVIGETLSELSDEIESYKEILDNEIAKIKSINEEMQEVFTKSSKESRNAETDRFLADVRNGLARIHASLSDLVTRAKEKLFNKIKDIGRRAKNYAEYILKRALDEIILPRIQTLIRYLREIANLLQSISFSINFNLGPIGVGFSFEAQP